MRAVICDGFDGPLALRVAEMPEPGLQAGHVLIDAGAWAEKFPLESAAANERLMRLVVADHIHPNVSGVMPLERVAEVMSTVANRTVLGRVVLRTR